MSPIAIRPLDHADIPTWLSLIEALADYEGLPRPDAEARSRLEREAVAMPPRFQVLLAERDGHVAGYAVYFETYSTFLARPTLYLEDLFVHALDRRHGVGRALMLELAREAQRLGCGRMEWQVLAWNAPAVDFYRRFGGRHLDDWQQYRLTADDLGLLASEAAGTR